MERRECDGSCNRVILQQQVGHLDRTQRRFHDVRVDFCSQSSPFLDQDRRHPALAWNVDLGQQIPLKLNAVVHGTLLMRSLSSGPFSSKPASGIIDRNAADFIPGSKRKSS
jgi:hypothetical protein